MMLSGTIGNSRPVVLVFGKNGQVGYELARALNDISDVIACDRDDVDLTVAKEIIGKIKDVKPDFVINCAAYTAVDKAEQEPELAYRVNSDAPGIMANAAKKVGAFMIQYSTDYVFDGLKNSSYLESDIPNPVNVYGESKLAGEKAIQSAGVDSLVLRTSWVYSARGHNFLLTVLRLLKEKPELRIVNDQYGSPTWARTLAELTAHVMMLVWRKRASYEGFSRLYHVSSLGKTSWHGFAEEIYNVIRASSCNSIAIDKKIIPINSGEFKVLASRPANSYLCSDKFQDDFDWVLPDWRNSLQQCMSEIEIM